MILISCTLDSEYARGLCSPARVGGLAEEYSAGIFVGFINCVFDDIIFVSKISFDGSAILEPIVQ